MYTLLFLFLFSIVPLFFIHLGNYVYIVRSMHLLSFFPPSRRNLSRKMGWQGFSYRRLPPLPPLKKRVWGERGQEKLGCDNPKGPFHFFLFLTSLWIRTQTINALYRLLHHYKNNLFAFPIEFSFFIPCPAQRDFYPKFILTFFLFFSLRFIECLTDLKLFIVCFPIYLTEKLAFKHFC